MGRLKMFHLNMMQASQVVTIVLISLSTNMNLVFSLILLSDCELKNGVGQHEMPLLLKDV